MITEKDLIEYGFAKNEGDAALFFPYEKEVGEDMYLFLCVSMLRNTPEFCIKTTDGMLYLKVDNLEQLKIIEQSISDYDSN